MFLGTRLHQAPRILAAILFVAGAAFGPACSSEDNPIAPGAGGSGGTAPVTCGDGVVDPNEDCDDQNQDDKDGCRKTCRFTCVDTEGCKDGDFCNGEELCDVATHLCNGRGPAKDNRETCGDNKYCVKGECVSAPIQCGDGFKYQGKEECDDANEEPDDGCEPDCTFTCEDDAGCANRDRCKGTWTCDVENHICQPGMPQPDGAACETGVCRGGSCTSKLCGNGTREDPEECDDGNLQPGDGCENDCRFSCDAADPTRNCALSDACAGTSTCVNHACSTPTPKADNTPCSAVTGGVCKGGACIDDAKCGDTMVQVDVHEECDDNNTDETDGCKSNCRFNCTTAASCDDKVVCNGGETCVTVVGGKVCQAGVPGLNGSACGASNVCVDGACVNSRCGDGVVDIRRSEQCEPPGGPGCGADCKSTQSCDLNGTWALKIAATVKWPATQVLLAGNGPLTSWAKIQRTQNGANITDTITPCGLDIPAFSSIIDETYKFDFSPSAFSNLSTLPSVTATYACSSSGPGAFCQTPFGVVMLGADATMVPDAELGELPANDDFGPFLRDHDGDGLPAMTGSVPASNAQVPVRIVVQGAETIVYRADRIYLVVRQISAFFGTIDNCDAISGDAVVTRADSRVVGCRLSEPASEAGKNCEPDDVDFADQNKFSLVPTAATFLQKRIQGSNCVDVRAAFPEP